MTLLFDETKKCIIWRKNGYFHKKTSDIAFCLSIDEFTFQLNGIVAKQLASKEYLSLSTNTQLDNDELKCW